jgi:hypothetical protein
VRELQQRRAAAMDMGRTVMDADNYVRADFMRAYDLVIELDRVGY